MKWNYAWCFSHLWSYLGLNMAINMCVLYIMSDYFTWTWLCFIQAEDNVSKGKLRVAVEDFKAALALDPNHTAHNVHLYLGLCKVLVKLGRGKDALSSCTEALNINEELIEALVQVCCVNTWILLILLCLPSGQGQFVWLLFHMTVFMFFLLDICRGVKLNF